jgi:hypothetical protein
MDYELIYQKNKSGIVFAYLHINRQYILNKDVLYFINEQFVSGLP